MCVCSQGPETRHPHDVCVRGKGSAAVNNTYALTLRGRGVLPAPRAGGRQAGRALLVLRRLDDGRHHHLLPC